MRSRNSEWRHKFCQLVSYLPGLAVIQTTMANTRAHARFEGGCYKVQVDDKKPYVTGNERSPVRKSSGYENMTSPWKLGTECMPRSESF